jgi:diguanylate cyclase (GGDEF)-like protein
MNRILATTLNRLTGSPQLLPDQITAFTRQIPLMYTVVIATSVGASITLGRDEPRWITVYCPAILCMACVIRIFVWWRLRGETLSEQQAKRRLIRTIQTAAILGLTFAAWVIGLCYYGNALIRLYVACSIVITVGCCLFCLLHVRLAAIVLTIVVLGPVSVFFFFTGNPMLISIAINMVIMAAAMVFVLRTYYRAFTVRVQSRLELEIRQAETQRLSDENARLANVDDLTGLPNRRQFFSLLERTLATCRDTGDRFVLGLMDIDGFKAINDAFGHAVGDAILIEAGRRLDGMTQEHVFVARLGGDEYGLLIQRDCSPLDLQNLGATLCKTLNAPHVIHGMTTHISGSIGLCQYTESAIEPTALYECADHALYQAKLYRRGQSVVFTKPLETEVRKHARIEQALRHADFAEELSVVFQSIMDLEKDQPCAFEALARWNSPELGMVPPAEFIPIAERSGRIADITQLLLAKALETARKWPQQIGLSFNLSIQDVASPEQIASLVRCVEASGVAPERITFEITETAVMRDFAGAQHSLLTLKALGARIALDDFGTGYSSLSYVHRLPLDKLKIDRSFMSNLSDDISSTAVLRSILELCRNLSLQCIVEGVETKEQALLLRHLGCHYAQGYYFARPIAESECLTFLRTKAISASAEEMNNRTEYQLPEHKIQSEKRWESELITAFQPIVSVSSDDICIAGYEALSRLRNGDSILEVLDGLPLEELYEFDFISRQLALKTARGLGLTGGLSMNVTPGAICHPRYGLAQTMQYAQEIGFPWQNIVFEITEREAIHDYKAVRNCIDGCRNKGVRIALDDFGSGFNGLHTLLELRPDIVKVDMALIRKIETDQDRQDLMFGICSGGSRLKMRLVAEGVETIETIRFLCEFGIDLMQGYYFAKPTVGALPSIDGAAIEELRENINAALQPSSVRIDGLRMRPFQEPAKA